MSSADRSRALHPFPGPVWRPGPELRRGRVCDLNRTPFPSSRRVGLTAAGRPAPDPGLGLVRGSAS